MRLALTCSDIFLDCFGGRSRANSTHALMFRKLLNLSWYIIIYPKRQSWLIMLANKPVVVGRPPETWARSPSTARTSLSSTSIRESRRPLPELWFLSKFVFCMVLAEKTRGEVLTQSWTRHLLRIHREHKWKGGRTTFVVFKPRNTSAATGSVTYTWNRRQPSVPKDGRAKGHRLSKQLWDLGTTAWPK